ncbi:thiamine phosphate synthase [Agitococcus lubricus]|uniref:Thiamine-phosphate synthase n=1 Tax=Agitococcus lubricus TaxID=1077255 RepID=A0A2T5IWT3_9GAMM|nr:thiamine phosphate synthase [Agitococcus lubricus]PTQ88397.1 thiamine-phosphate diphosphorylase [Agitococcus lubricus]
MKHGVYVITDSLLLHGRLLEAVEQALIGGANLVQYRAKQATASTRYQEAFALKSLCVAYEVPLIINDDLDLAARLKVGVHLGRGDGAIELARQRLGDKAIIGATCHNSLEFAAQAVDAGASYLAFGAFYPSPSKPLASLADINILRQAQVFNLPLVAIGGITLDNAPPLITAGANYLAMISEIFAKPNTEIAPHTAAFRHLF